MVLTYESPFDSLCLKKTENKIIILLYTCGCVLLTFNHTLHNYTDLLPKIYRTNVFNAKYLLYIFNFGLNWCSGEFHFWRGHTFPKIIVKYSTQTVRAKLFSTVIVLSTTKSMKPFLFYIIFYLHACKYKYLQFIYEYIIRLVRFDLVGRHRPIQLCTLVP